MSAREWKSTPWYEQMILIEGLENEGLVQRGTPAGGAMDGLLDERVRSDGGVTVTERDFSYDLSEYDVLPEGDFQTGTIG